MYLLLIPLFAAVLFDRIQKLRRSIKKDDREAIRTDALHAGLIVVVMGILIALVEFKQD